MDAPQALMSQTQEFLSLPRQMLIGGEWVGALSGKTIESINPADETVLTVFPAGEAEDVDRAVSAARDSFERGNWSRMMPIERGRVMARIADLIEANADLLAELESLDNGKPVAQAKAVDVASAVKAFRYDSGWCSRIEGKTVELSRTDAEYHAYTRQEPIGVAALIVPWNYPLMMAAYKLSPALAAGCSVILKPAEETSLTALKLGELLLEAGLPEGVINIVTGLGETAGAALSAHPGVDKIAFTGSNEVGRKIIAAAAGNLKKVTLELGGKSPTIILADADLDAAIPGAAMAIFANSGQSCIAGSRLFVEKPVFDRVMEGMETVASTLKIGAGLLPDSDLGPLVSRTQLDRVTGYVDRSRTDGANIAFGGKRYGEAGFFYQPTAVLDTHADMEIRREEVFGPVVTASPVADVEEIAAMANDTSYGLASGIWTRDLSMAHKLAKRIKAGSVWVNCSSGRDPSLPFGGYKQSGWGREGGVEGVQAFLETKTVCIKL